MARQLLWSVPTGDAIMVINQATIVPFFPTLSGDPRLARWRNEFPTLHQERATLRELEVPDAESLLQLLTPEEVSRFVSPPPTTREGFERFIRWTLRERAEGRHVCFGVLPPGYDHAVGLFQIRQLSDRFSLADWGFAIGAPFWGSGLFEQSARAVLEFAFSELGVQRLEARACVPNERGNGALRKVGAVCEATLNGSFIKEGRRIDQHLWTIDVSAYGRSGGGRRA